MGLSPIISYMQENKPSIAGPPQSFTPAVKSGFTEIFGGILVISAILIFLALSSFQSQISRGVEPLAEYNLIGSLGHYSAEVFFLMFGKSAFLLGPYFLLLGVLTIMRGGFSDPLARLSAILIMIIGSSILGAVLNAKESIPSQVVGGLIGARMGGLLQSLLGLYGSAILAVGILMSGIFLAIRMPMSLFLMHFQSLFRHFLKRYAEIFSGGTLAYPSDPVSSAAGPGLEQRASQPAPPPWIERVEKTEKQEMPAQEKNTSSPIKEDPNSLHPKAFQVSQRTRDIQAMLAQMQRKQGLESDETPTLQEDDLGQPEHYFDGYFDPDGSRFHFRCAPAANPHSYLSSQAASLSHSLDEPPLHNMRSRRLCTLEKSRKTGLELCGDEISRDRLKDTENECSTQNEQSTELYESKLQEKNKQDLLQTAAYESESQYEEHSELHESDHLESDRLESDRHLYQKARHCEVQEQGEQEEETKLIYTNQTESEFASVQREVLLPDSLVPKLSSSYENYHLSIDFLQKTKSIPQNNIAAEINDTRTALKKVMREYGIQADVVDTQRGPIITLYEIKLEPGIKVSRVLSLQSEICMSLAVPIVRIIAPIPGKSTIGIEIPNRVREPVLFSQLLPVPPSSLRVVLGKNIAGENQYAELTQLPHLLIAGATGAGKSVYLNAVIASLLYQASPEDIRFVMIDPKMVELKLYEGIPHLLMPVITDVYEASKALRWLIDEMERRYCILSALRCRDIRAYNQRVKKTDQEQEHNAMPYIVVLIDELSDLMMIAAKDVEDSIIRLTQKARAVGIHIIMATQRPSVDVITALIKANCPARVAFQVSQRTDSRTILDASGAENLLGKGDLLYKSPHSTLLTRIQAPLLSVEEVEAIVRQARTFAKTSYVDLASAQNKNSALQNEEEVDEELFQQALDVVLESGKTSSSYLQRRMRVGYNRAANLIEMMEERGYLSPIMGNKPREILKRD